jgi:hypothetical protein
MMNAEDNQPPPDAGRESGGCAVAVLAVPVLMCCGLIAGGVVGVVTKTAGFRRSPMSGLEAQVMSSAGIFFGLVGLRALWMLRGGPRWVAEDSLVKVLVGLAGAALLGGFLLFVLGGVI